MAVTALAVLYRDDSLLVVDKPSGLLVHRGWDNDRVVALTLARAIAGKHVYPVHRLDRATSGVLVFTLDSETAAIVHGAFERGEVRKRYVALVRGVPPEQIVVDHPVPRSEKGERVPAVTEVRRLHVLEGYAVVEARPRTGRLHQIRRHLRHLAHPIIGDVTYGDGKHNRAFRTRYGLHRLALHASELELAHPVTGERLVLGAPLPEDLRGPFDLMGVPRDVG